MSHLTAFICFAKVAQGDSPQNIWRETQFAPNQFYLCSGRKQNTIKHTDIKKQAQFDLERGLNQELGFKYEQQKVSPLF